MPCSSLRPVFILDCLSKYEPSEKEAEDIVERVSPRLKHANSAVAMSAVKVSWDGMWEGDGAGIWRLFVVTVLGGTCFIPCSCSC